MSKRKCIFTGEDSDFKLTIEQEDQHNWAKSVPTTKAYYNAYLKDRPLNELELRQVELFFQSEINKVKQSTLERRMAKIRDQIAEGMTSFQTVEQLKFYKPDIQFSEEMEEDILDKVKERRSLRDIAEEMDRINKRKTVLEVDGKDIEPTDKIKYEEKPTILEVSETTYKEMQEIIKNPPEPTEALVKAFKEAKELTEEKEPVKVEKKVVKKKPTLWD